LIAPEMMTMSRQDAPGERTNSAEDAEVRACRRIADALERDDIDALAAALGQVPDSAWPAPDTYGGRKISRGGNTKRLGLWSGLRRLTTMLRPGRQS
jgi:hypothetical protein